MKFRERLLLSGICIAFLLFSSIAAFAQNAVKGKLTSSSGEPLSGATVQVKGTNKSVLTATDGSYSIAAPLKSSLVFSYVGYADKELVVTGGEINISLTRSTDNMNDVVVIGYQSVKRKDLTGAVDVVNVNDAKKVTAATVGEALQGLATGVDVRSSGRAGSEAVVEIRGNGSLLSNSPMYVIDGLPLTTANRDFNPADIESIQILKDASAAAIYGSRAANGVIIITTRKGKDGPMKTDFSARVGGEDIKRFKVAGTNEWLALNKEAYDNSGTPYMQGVATYGQPGNTASTNWQDQVLRRGQTQDYDLGFSGGNVNNSYFLSGSYFKNTGSIINSNFERETFRVNTESRKGRFKMGENMIFSNSRENIPQGNPLQDMLSLLPIMPVYDSSNLGGFATGNQNFFTAGVNSVAQNALSTANSSNVRIKGNAFAEVKLLPWITYRFNVGLETNWAHYRQFNIPGRISKDVQNDVAALVESRDQGWDIITEHTLNFIKDFGNHHIDGVAGFNFQQDYYSNVLSNGTGFDAIGTGNAYLSVLTAANSTYSSGGVNQWAARSFFGRLNYSYDGRYLLSGTVRQETDSRFGAGYKNATFPAVSGAWNISKEKFFTDRSINLKLRGSYGSLGNVTIAPWQYLGTANSTIRYIFSGGTPLVGATQTTLVHQDLRWETDNTTDIGADGSFMNNRLSFTADYFKRVSKNVLTLNDPIPAYLTGNSNPPYPAVNAASLQNTGAELSLTYRNNTNPFKFDLTGNITVLRNKLQGLGANSTNYVQEPLTRSQVGRSLGEYYLLKTDGIFQNQAEIDSYVDKNGNKIQPTAAPGDQKFIQYKTNGVSGITADDRTFRGSPWPKFQAGLVWNASYGGWSLNMLWFGSFGSKLYDGSRAYLENLQNNNEYAAGLKPWTSQNPHTSTPRAFFGSGTNSSADASLDVIGISDRWLESGSFVRLRNIELSYSLPAGTLMMAKISNARIFISGQNLITITKYKGLDPEVANTDIFSRGVDNIQYPANRIVSAGLQLGF